MAADSAQSGAVPGVGEEALEHRADFLAVCGLVGGEAAGLAGAEGGADAGGDLRVEQGGAALEQVEDAVGISLVDALDGLRQVAEAAGALAELADGGDLAESAASELVGVGDAGALEDAGVGGVDPAFGEAVPLAEFFEVGRALAALEAAEEQRAALVDARDGVAALAGADGVFAVVLAAADVPVGEPAVCGVSAQYALGAALREAPAGEIAVVFDDLGRDAGDFAVFAPDEGGDGGVEAELAVILTPFGFDSSGRC